MSQRPAHRLLARREVRDLIETQSGVVARRQLLELGVTENELRVLLRRELVSAMPGVYLTHNGTPTWRQRAWTAVLALWPAALSHHSALRLDDGPGRSVPERSLIDVAIDRGRSASTPSGVRLHYVTDFDRPILWTASPPRVRIEHAVLDVAASAPTEMIAIAALSDAVQSRRTTPDRLRTTLDARDRIARRRLLEGVLDAVGLGVNSCLEHGYLTLVAEPHGLPSGDRQAQRRGLFDDVRHDEFGLIVELDGRCFHDTATARDRDLDRDLDAAVDALRTVRLGWGQVYGRPCVTAARVGVLLQRGGWTGSPTACSACPRSLAA